MSFSQEVKEEILNKYTKATHCQKAQLAAFLVFDGKNVKKDSEKDCYIYNFTSGRKTFNIRLDTSEGLEKLTERTCCKRAFLKGAFIGAGTISDPEKEYRFDIVCSTEEQAEFLRELFGAFEIRARVTNRRGKYVLYIKEGELISEALNVLEAHKAMMDFENIRIVKEMRGSINRQVNCETANINKAIAASMKQARDIELILEKRGEDSLDENLAAVANARLQYPDVTLAELGNLMTPAISKSAVNHRMRKISQLAEELRRQEKEEP
ncbi:MAG: DNA-binding protein WhiA [Lachnospiraceae bacterium]|nr:DNA-binding protein WhiA [Lachnospiraceae bacterium]